MHRFPEASGGVVWVEEAFGPLAGWMSGFQSWVAGATGKNQKQNIYICYGPPLTKKPITCVLLFATKIDNAIYPVLFLDYLLQVAGTRTTNDDDSISGDYENMFH